MASYSRIACLSAALALTAVSFSACGDTPDDALSLAPESDDAGRVSSSLLTADQVHAAATVVVAHDHRLTGIELVSAQSGGVSGLGIDFTVDGFDWLPDGGPVPTNKWQDFTTFYNKNTQLNSIIAGGGGQYRKALSVQDFYTAKDGGGVAVIVGSEGVNHIPGSNMSPLRTAVQYFYGLGWRKTQIWYPTCVGCGGVGSDETFFSSNGTPQPGTAAELIAELNRTAESGNESETPG